MTTSWEDIGGRAEVVPATVYRHVLRLPFFKSLLDAGVKRSEVTEVIVGLALSCVMQHVRKQKHG